MYLLKKLTVRFQYINTMKNREKEMKQKETYREGWKISAKYSSKSGNP